MTPISKFEEQVALLPVTGVNVARQRLLVSDGWTYRIVELADLAGRDGGTETERTGTA